MKNLDVLLREENAARVALEKIATFVQDQHRLPQGDPLKYSHDQMVILFDRLDVARKAHDAAYAALDAAE